MRGMAKYDDLIKRIEQLQRQFSLLDSAGSNNWWKSSSWAPPATPSAATRLEAVLKRIEALEKAPTKVIIPDHSVELGALRDRVRDLERKEAERSEMTTDPCADQPLESRTSWRELVDRQHKARVLTDDDLTSALLYHLRRLYEREESNINALARIITLVEYNKDVTARPQDIVWSPVTARNLGEAIIHESWGQVADIAAVLLAEELAK